MGGKLQPGVPGPNAIILETSDKRETPNISRDFFNIGLFPHRDGFIEETYVNSTFLPLLDMDGGIGGLYNSTVEVTKKRINERRLAMFNYMANPSAVNSGTLASHVIPQLERNPLDITMALLYELGEERTACSTKTLDLRGSLGVPHHHSLAIQTAMLNDSEGLIPLFRENSNEILTFPVNKLFDGVEWRGFGKSNHFSVLPIAGPNRVFGYLVIGVNPRRPIDADHHQFMWDLASKISAIAASVSSADESRRRAQRLENELQDRATQIQYLAQHASVGMSHSNLDQHIVWANEQYYQLVGRRREEMDYPCAFLDTLLDEDRKKAKASWDKVVREMVHDSVELRLKNIFITPSGERQHTVALVFKFPRIEDGVVKSVMACMTDVSRLKWTESVEAQKATDAEAAKRQQEEFIDIVSHEMRNPLSAIFQCADMIRSSITECEQKGYSAEDVEETLKSNAENCSVIILCAQHQKRIVDDVLTLSKLEHMKLLITPRPTQPMILLEEVLKMFEADIEAHDIKVDIKPDSSVQERGLDWVLCDPSRVSQILINLVTNAIKFTQGQPDREISIHCGYRLSEPRKGFPSGMRWAPSHLEPEELTPGSEEGEMIYLVFSVCDTGVGMTRQEIMKLFNRFNQANPKTFIKYGGSGLGLFISQRLTEMQGGEIGVASIRHEGTTFGFYVKARTTDQGSISGHSSSVSEDDDMDDIDFNNINVLVVEDDIINQRILRKQLMKAGCHVDVENDGARALKYLSNSGVWFKPVSKNKRVHVILMDSEMPIMDGLATTREIRSLEKKGNVTEHIKIIATTANAREEQIQNIMESGAVSLSCVIIFWRNDSLTNDRMR